MIFGVGIDIIEVDRVKEKILKNSGFTEKIFSSQEIEYCERASNKFQHYAARFAAKEAFIKAAKTGLTESYDLYEVEIAQDDRGAPSIILSGKMNEMAKRMDWTSIHVSLSHIASVACAVVTIEK